MHKLVEPLFGYKAKVRFRQLLGVDLLQDASGHLCELEQGGLISIWRRIHLNLK